jgi:hypothetical protein
MYLSLQAAGKMPSHYQLRLVIPASSRFPDVWCSQTIDHDALASMYHKTIIVHLAQQSTLTFVQISISQSTHHGHFDWIKPATICRSLLHDIALIPIAMSDTKYLLQPFFKPRGGAGFTRS